MRDAKLPDPKIDHVNPHKNDHAHEQRQEEYEEGGAAVNLQTQHHTRGAYIVAGVRNLARKKGNLMKGIPGFFHHLP